MEGASCSSSSSSAAAVQGGRAGEVGIRVGATNIGRLRGAAPGRQQQQGRQPQHGARGGGGGVTSWHLRVFAAAVGVMGCVLLAASLAMSALHQVQFRNAAISRNVRGLQVRLPFAADHYKIFRIPSPSDFERPCWWFVWSCISSASPWLLVPAPAFAPRLLYLSIFPRLIPFFNSTTSISNKSLAPDCLFILASSYCPQF